MMHSEHRTSLLWGALGPIVRRMARSGGPSAARGAVGRRMAPGRARGPIGRRMAGQPGRAAAALAIAALASLLGASSAPAAPFVDVTYDLSDTTGSTVTNLGGGLLFPTTDIPPDGMFSGTMEIRYESSSQSSMPVLTGPTSLLTFNLYVHATLYTGTAVTPYGGTTRTKLGTSDLHFELLGGPVAGGLLTAPGTILGGGSLQLRLTGSLHCYVLCEVGLDIPASTKLALQTTTITVARPTLYGSVGPYGGAQSTRHTLSGVQFASFTIDPGPLGGEGAAGPGVAYVSATTNLVGREILREAEGHEPKVIPEPSTVLLVAAALLGLAGLTSKRAGA